MSGFIARQPNGKYCRFSTVVDCPTHINMTFEDHVKVIMERGYQEWKAREEAQEVINNYLYPFEAVSVYFVPNNMTEKEFKEYIEKMKDPNGEYEVTQKKEGRKVKGYELIKEMPNMKLGTKIRRIKDGQIYKLEKVECKKERRFPIPGTYEMYRRDTADRCEEEEQKKRQCS